MSSYFRKQNLVTWKFSFSKARAYHLHFTVIKSYPPVNLPWSVLHHTVHEYCKSCGAGEIQGQGFQMIYLNRDTSSLCLAPWSALSIHIPEHHPRLNLQASSAHLICAGKHEHTEYISLHIFPLKCLLIAGQHQCNSSLLLSRSQGSHLIKASLSKSKTRALNCDLSVRSAVVPFSVVSSQLKHPPLTGHTASGRWWARRAGRGLCDGWLMERCFVHACSEFRHSAPLAAVHN